MGGERKPLPTEEFVNQRVGNAIGKIDQTVFRLAMPLAPQQPNHKRAAYIIERSARNYGLHAYSRKTWEATVKRQEMKQITGVDGRPDPEQVF
jgi:hypothetical protein